MFLGLRLTELDVLGRVGRLRHSYKPTGSFRIKLAGKLTQHLACEGPCTHQLHIALRKIGSRRTPVIETAHKRQKRHSSSNSSLALLDLKASLLFGGARGLVRF